MAAGDESLSEFQARMIDELREFMRSTTLRSERILQANIRELSRMNDELERHGDVLEHNTAELERHGRERREEARAEREALWRVIDRLDRLDPPPAAA